MAGSILVLGATGNVGRPLVAALVAKGERVKAASRQATSVSGAEAVRFDYADLSLFGPALDGVDRAYVLAPSGTTDVIALLRPILEAATKRNVKIVLQTALGVDADDSIPYRQMELFLERSGVPFVILRPNWFADNFHTFWRPGIQHGVIALPAADGKTSFIDIRDIAASAAAALTTNRFDGKAFNLTGPQALSYHEAAGILSEVIGRPIRYTPIADAAFVAMLTGAGLSEAYAQFLASIFHPVRQGWTAAVTGDVLALAGRAPLSLQTYAKDHTAALAG